MISRGMDVVTLSGPLGHKANPRVTLETYSHMYDREKIADAVREAMA
jgi:hypothetical protein